MPDDNCADYLEITGRSSGTIQQFCGNTLFNMTSIAVYPNSSLTFISNGNDITGRGFDIDFFTMKGIILILL